MTDTLPFSEEKLGRGDTAMAIYAATLSRSYVGIARKVSQLVLIGREAP